MRLAAGLKVSALLRAVAAAGGFAAVLAKGDAIAGSIVVVARDGASETVLAPVMAGDGRYVWSEAVRGPAVPQWIDRARRFDPDLWIVEIDLADAAALVARTLVED